MSLSVSQVADTQEESVKLREVTKRLYEQLKDMEKRHQEERERLQVRLMGRVTWHDFLSCHYDSPRSLSLLIIVIICQCYLWISSLIMWSSTWFIFARQYTQLSGHLRTLPADVTTGSSACALIVTFTFFFYCFRSSNKLFSHCHVMNQKRNGANITTSTKELTLTRHINASLIRHQSVNG